MREFWQGRASLRKLRVLLENIPPGYPTGAIEGHCWGNQEDLLFRILGLLHVISSEFPGVKPKDVAKAIEALPPYPWSKLDSATVRYGDAGGASPEIVMQYLDSLGR
nr:MAG TPA: protein of unknown function (DUF5361) [Caudoviricetes sp.]